jgi:electron transfer flavoprotein beta subunit
MKILVMVKQVPDTATQVKIGGDGKQIDTAGITWIVSPYDEFAVEEALRIKEKCGQGEVVAVSLGPDRAKEALRSALAMGCDRAIHVNDDDMGAIGAQLAELLGWPCASWIMEEVVDGDAKTVRVGRQVEGGLEIFELPLPAVLTAQKGINEPRYPTLKGIMGAKKKEIKDLKSADLGLQSVTPELSITALQALPARPPGRIVPGEVKDAVKELVRALREDAKAI